MPKKTYVIYDARAAGDMGTNDAQVYCTASTLDEAKHDVRSMFPDGEIYEYDLVDNEALNKRWIPRNYQKQKPMWFE